MNQTVQRVDVDAYSWDMDARYRYMKRKNTIHKGNLSILNYQGKQVKTSDIHNSTKKS